MGRIKGWKRWIHGPGSYEATTPRQGAQLKYIWITYRGPALRVVSSYPYEIVGQMAQGKIIRLNESFKTQAKAVKFVQGYIKRHPNG